jgi:hypothetical protein
MAMLKIGGSSENVSRARMGEKTKKNSGLRANALFQ